MITSTRNPRVQAAARLHRRRTRTATGQTIVEGPGAVEEAIAAGVTIVDAFVLEDDEKGRDLVGDVGLVVSPPVLAAVAGTDNPRGPVMVVQTPDARVGEGDLLTLVGVGDPGNAGTLIRSAAAFGFGVVATPGTVDLWAPKTVRAAAGAHFRTTVAMLDHGWMERCRDGGRLLGALVVSGGEPLAALSSGPVALLVGDEAAGLAPEIVTGADVRLTIGMPGGTESLNAAIAGSIAMYERSRRR